MKKYFYFVTACLLAFSCSSKTGKNNSEPESLPIEGSWKLLSGTIIENGDTVVTDYTCTHSFIKIINKTHFAFLQHDLTKGQDSAAYYMSGGGAYTLKDNTYTEHLEYCTQRNLEDNYFTFTVTVKNDTFIQSGLEKVEEAGLNRINIEKYVRIK